MIGTPTNNDIYLKLGELAAATAAIDDKIDRQHERLNDHGVRLLKLETEQTRLTAKVKTVAALIGAGVGGAASLVAAALRDTIELPK